MTSRNRFITCVQVYEQACSIPCSSVKSLSALTAAVLICLAPANVLAQQVHTADQIQQSIAFNIPAQPLANALNIFSLQSRHQVLFDQAVVAGHTAPAISGNYTPRQALKILIAGTGLQINDSVAGAFAVTSEGNRSSVEGTLPEVLVVAGMSKPEDLLPAYAGGQIASGSRVGLLGNRDVMDTPFSTTSYTVQMIENQQASTVAQVLRADSSVREIFPEAGPAEHFNIRGFYTQSQDFAWNGLYGLAPNNRSATEMLERVELLKGPGALLYGMALSGSAGGVVNLVPKRAGDESLTRLTTTFASDSNLGAHLDMGRRFGENKELGVRVNLAKSEGDTVVDDQSQDKELGAIALDFRGQRLRASLDAYSLEENQTGGMSLLTSFAASEIPKAPDPTTNALPGAYSNSQSKVLVGSLEFDFDDQWTGFAKLGTKRQDGAGFLNNAMGVGAQSSGNYTGVAMNVKNFFDADSAEVGIRGRVRTWEVDHDLVLGANAIKQKWGLVANRVLWASNIYAPAVPPTLPDEPAVVPRLYDTNLSSFALADTLSFLDGKYLLTLGVRQQRVRVTNYDTSGIVTTRYDEDALTPAVGFVAKPWSAPVSLYANYIEGLSQGGSVTDTTAANYGEVFAPYKTKQVELGVKWDAGTFLNTLSVFQITQPSLIKDTNTNRYAPDGEQRNRGVEWSSAGEVIDGLRLLGGATYIKAENTKTNGGLLDGMIAIGVPRWQVNLGADWDTPWLPGLTLGATTIHTGHQYANSLNTQKLPSWTRIDLGMRYQTKLIDRNVVFRGSVTNAFDKRYWSGTLGGSTSVGAARGLKLSMSVDF